MANVSHDALTGSELHEPKGADTAVLGTVYVSDGAGSGSWESVGTASFTGMIADFAAPVAPVGWLELDGSTISTTTYSGLFAVMSMSISGTRSNGSPVITSISDTSNLRAGYYVFGTGISSGTTIDSVDSATQITLSNNASSSGTSSFKASPWLLDTGTVKLPDLTTNGRYRRSRSSTTKVGDLQADQNSAHTHTFSSTGTTDTSATHTHANTLHDPSHTHSTSGATVGNTFLSMSRNDTIAPTGEGSIVIGSATTGISITNAAGGAHSHTVTSSGTTDSTGSTETRPLTAVFLTCVKT